MTLKSYRTRPGIVLTSVCGERLLVAAKANLELCPYVSQINDSSAYLWEKLKNGASEEELFTAVESDFDVEDPDSLRAVISDFISNMLKNNYLLITEQGGNNEQ